MLGCLDGEGILTIAIFVDSLMAVDLGLRRGLRHAFLN